jgi:hypothetical protein
MDRLPAIFLSVQVAVYQRGHCRYYINDPYKKMRMLSLFRIIGNRLSPRVMEHASATIATAVSKRLIVPRGFRISRRMTPECYTGGLYRDEGTLLLPFQGVYVIIFRFFCGWWCKMLDAARTFE